MTIERVTEPSEELVDALARLVPQLSPDGERPGLHELGEIVAAPGTVLSPTFVDCGIHHLMAMRLLAAFVRSYNKQVASILDRPLRRFAGDMAALGKGEIFCLPS